MPRLRTHPGEILAEEYLKPLGLSASALAQAIGVPGNRISDIIRGRRDVSADTAIRLGRYFDVDPRFWMNLQAAHDLSRAEAEHDHPAVRPRTELRDGGDRVERGIPARAGRRLKPFTFAVLPDQPWYGRRTRLLP